jgi:hypothetical protein
LRRASLALLLAALAAAGGAVLAAADPPGSAGNPVPPAQAPPLVGGPTPVAPGALSDRSREILRLDCSSRLGRREVTLFANGTVRLRDGPVGKEWMGLAELSPEELHSALVRLTDEDLGGATDVRAGIVGDWIEHCDLVLDLPGKPERRISFGRYDTLSLGVSRLRRVAEELGNKVRSLSDVDQLPVGYEPRLGDVLKRIDGNSYRVVNFTSDRKGVELDGLEQPLHLIVLKEQMRIEFVALLTRQP